MHKYQNYGRILAFKLGGGETPLPPKVVRKEVPAPPPFSGDEAEITKGGLLYWEYCGICHGAFGD